MPKIDLMKINVEGSEYNVFLGAKKTIISSKPTILVDLLNKWIKPFGHKPQALISALINLDYICFAIIKGKLREISLVNGFYRDTNFIFCHRSKINHMKYLYTLVA